MATRLIRVTKPAAGGSMPDRKQYDETDPRHHTEKLKQVLNDTANHAREDVAKILPEGTGVI